MGSKHTYFDPKQILLEKIKQRGGWVNAHAHIDRAFLATQDNLADTVTKNVVEKWDYPDEWKAQATVQDIYNNMAACIENLIGQGGQAMGSFIDCDSVVKDKALLAADKIRKDYGKQIKLKFIHQPIKGLMDKTERQWFEEAASFVDIIGGLPERDSEVKIGVNRKAEHLDILFETAKKQQKPLHVHVDQFNTPDQRDTELLADKTAEHRYPGKVTAVHCISLASQPKADRERVYKKLADNQIMIVACPISWLDSPRQEIMAPLHNSATPIDEMIPAGLTVAIGTDGIHDFYEPLIDGDMWTELYVLSQVNRFRDLDALADIASTNGLKVLGL